MTNQRAPKLQRAAVAPGNGNISIRQLIDFSQSAAASLAAEGQEDAAFYFEQLAEHLQSNPEKGLNESVSRILGL
jgi:hypothetical protein